MRSSWSASCARVRLDHPDKDVTWLSPAGEEMATEQWEDGNARCFGMLLDGRAQESGVKRRGSDATLMTMVNFTLPSVPEGRHWQGLIDTNRPDSLAPLPSIRSARCLRHNRSLRKLLAFGPPLRRLA